MMAKVRVSVLEKRKTLHTQAQNAQEYARQVEQKLAQSIRLSGLGLAWALAAHELNNLLGPMVNFAQLALQHAEDQHLQRKALEKTVLLGRRAALIAEKTMRLASGQKMEKTVCLAKEIFQDALLCIGRDFGKDGIDVLLECPDHIAVWADKELLSQAIITLILNARRAMLGRGGRLVLSGQQTEKFTVLRIADTGCGMTEEVLERIFEPFYTTAPDNSGTGLGLVFCKYIVQAHQGTISVQSAPQQGSVFTVQLPAPNA